MAETRTRLTDLQAGANFIPRHIGPQSNELTDMLKAVGASSLDDLVEKVVPKKIRSDRALDLPVPLSERNALSDLRKVAGRNQVFTSMIGMGITAVSRQRSSCATSWKIPAGTPPTRHTRPKSARAGLKPCSISSRWSAT